MGLKLSESDRKALKHYKESLWQLRAQLEIFLSHRDHETCRVVDDLVCYNLEAAMFGFDDILGTWEKETEK